MQLRGQRDGQEGAAQTGTGSGGRRQDGTWKIADGDLGWQTAVAGCRAAWCVAKRALTGQVEGDGSCSADSPCHAGRVAEQVVRRRRRKDDNLHITGVHTCAL